MWDDYDIRPLIDTRAPWRQEKNLPDYDPSKPITRSLPSGPILAFQGFEADRNTLKYRCPAAAYGLECQGQAQCHQAGGVTSGEYARIVRIKLDEHDRRIFVPTPLGGPSWQRGYNRRSALERINNRIDRHFGFEQHFISGIAKMTTRVGLAIAVMMAMTLGHIQQGRPAQMRSLVRRSRRPASPQPLTPAQIDRGKAPERGACLSFRTDRNGSHLRCLFALPSALAALLETLSRHPVGYTAHRQQAPGC